MNQMQTEKATLGNGCFWCTEAIFSQLNGVINVKSGYSGGHMVNPDYKSVCTGTTGHAECLEIEYDPEVLSFEDLLKVFWETHDPTTKDRQGNDIGPQYRSVIFYHNDYQKITALEYKKKLDESAVFSSPIVTEIEKYIVFYPAESYHDNYFNSHTNEPYCHLVVRPKVEKFKKLYSSKLK